MVGRFVEKKGFHLALEALGLMKDQLPPFEVNLIGYGELEDAYKQLVQKYQLENEVNFLGGKNHQEVIQALREHDIFLHPSLTAANGDSEGGAPTIIIEAQAVGIPVVASTHADIPYVMGYHNFLAEEADIESLKETIIRACAVQDWEQYINAGKSKVLEQHDRSDIYNKNLQSLLNI
jgi:colanic acid/amylovoran biosynthesis glycosyltransferase